jgi:cytochrome c oxidase subunit 4
VTLTQRNMQLLMCLVAGLMLGVAVLHLMPHAFIFTGSIDAIAYGMLAGLLVMWALVRLFHFHQHVAVDQQGHIEAVECGHDHAHPHEHHVVSWKVYALIFGALCVLTAVTVLVTGYDFGPFNLIVALGVAVTKANLVVLYFMHARYSPKLTGVVIASSIAFFVILVFLTLTDYLSRPWPLTAAG